MITREEFIALYQERITRRGADKLLDWMTNTDFFTAPASTRYHLACAGGLMEHSAHVYYRLRKVVSSEYGDESPYSEETLAVCGLLHDLCKVNFYKEDIRNVKENGVWVVGADAGGDKNLYDADIADACAIVIGSEGNGLSRIVRDKCDFIVSIPMKGKVNSLNASAAAAVLLYEAVRQRAQED